MKIAVTGATGYIGERVLRAAERDRIPVLCLTRRPPAGGEAWQHFDLQIPGSVQLPADVSAVIHLAADTQERSEARVAAEIAAAADLIASARRVGARFLFVSSQTADAGSVSPYGRTKWAIERMVLEAAGTVVRPGQVYGGPLRGLYGRLANLVIRYPILPALLPAPRLQPIHVDDLVGVLFNLSRRRGIEGRLFCLGAEEPISFTLFLKCLARVRLRRARLFVPLPVVGIQLLTKLPIRQADALRSLLNLKPMQTAADMSELQVQLRPLVAGMELSGHCTRRNLLKEGRALLSYVCRIKLGSASLARRYVRAVEALRGGQPLGFPSVVCRLPWLIRATEPIGAARSEISWRINAATTLAEADVRYASRFILLRKSSSWRFLRVLVKVALAEAAWRLFTLGVRPLRRLHRR